MKLLSLQLSQLQLTVTQLQMSTVSTFQQSVVTHQTIIHLPVRKTTLKKVLWAVGVGNSLENESPWDDTDCWVSCGGGKLDMCTELMC